MQYDPEQLKQKAEAAYAAICPTDTTSNLRSAFVGGWIDGFCAGGIEGAESVLTAVNGEFKNLTDADENLRRPSVVAN